MRSRILVVGARLSLEGVDFFEWKSESGAARLPDNIDALDDYSTIIIVEPSEPLHLGGAENRLQEIRRFLSTKEHDLVLVGRNQIEWLSPCRRVEAVGRANAFDVVGGIDFPIWFDQVRFSHYEYAYPVDSPSASTGVIPAQNLNPSFEPIATNRAGSALGFQVRFAAHGCPGRVAFLPRPTACPVEDSIEWMLRAIYRVKSKSDAPSWISEFSLPRLDEARIELAENAAQIASLRAIGDELQVKVERESRLLDLLFESGIVLEERVLEALGELGASVVERPTRTEHDGIIRPPNGRTVLLEVKGNGKSLKLEDDRQLDGWLTDLRYASGAADVEIVGLLIVNAWRDVNPSMRQRAIPANVERYCRDRGLRTLLTVDLLDVVRRMQEGSLDLSDWWDRLLESEAGAAEVHPKPGKRSS